MSRIVVTAQKKIYIMVYRSKKRKSIIESGTSNFRDRVLTDSIVIRYSV